jgi:serine/threonine protein kinase
MSLDTGHAKRSVRMDWNTRVKIALGAALGLAYLHQDCKPQVVHRDVKSCNILLNANMEAHICDVGLAIEYSAHSDSHVYVCTGYHRMD